jgi:hypothetical protein
MRTTKLLIYQDEQVFPTNLDLSLQNTSGWTFSPVNSMIYSNNSLIFDPTITTAPNFVNLTLYTTLFIPTHKYRVEYIISGANSNMMHNIYLNYGQSKTNIGNGVFSVEITCKNQPKMGTNIVNSRFYIGLLNNISLNLSISGIKVYEIIENEIDLYNNDSISLTLSLQELTDISKRASTYSKTIKIPGTANNNIVFKHVYQVASKNSFRLNYPIKARFIDKNDELFNGYLLLKGVDVSNNDKNFEYECVLKSDINTLFKITSEKLLFGNLDPADDIDFSEYDHIKNYSNISSSWWKGSVIKPGFAYMPNRPTYSLNKNTDVLGTGYVYPLIDYGQNTTTVELSEMRPAIFMYEVFKKVLNSAGFTFTSTFLESDRFKRMIYPRTTKVTTNEINSGELTYTNSLLEPTLSGHYIRHSKDSSSLIQLTVADDIPFNINQGFGNSNYWTCYNSGDYNIDLTINNVLFWSKASVDGTMMHLRTNGGQDANGWSICGHVIVEMIRFRNGVASLLEILHINKEDYSSADLTFPKWSNSQYGSKNISGNYSLLAGDIVKVQTSLFSYHNYKGKYNWNNNYNVDAYIYYLIPANSASLKIKCTEASSIGENSLVKLNYNLHPIKQSDFLKGILNTFNLMVDIDPNKKNNLIIEPYTSFYTGGITQNWSDKRDLSSVFNIDEASDINRKNLKLKWDIDTDQYNQAYLNSTKDREYGDNVIYSDQKTTETTTIKSIFAPTPMTNFVVDKNKNKLVTPIIVETPELDSYYNKVYNKNITFKPRILYWAGLIYWNTSNDPHLGNPGFPEWRMKTINLEYVYGWSFYFSSFYPYAGHVDKPLNNEATFNLNFGTNYWYWFTDSSKMTYHNLSNDYYSNMLLEFSDKDSKKVTGMFNLTSKDISDFNFKNPVVIKEGGIDSYYRVSKIVDYTPGKLTKVELLKIIKQDIPISYNKWNYVSNLTTNPVANNESVYVNSSIKSSLSKITPIKVFVSETGTTTITEVAKPINEYVNMIRGGYDCTQYMYSPSIINMVRGGYNATRNYGSHSNVSLIKDDIKANNLTNEIDPFIIKYNNFEDINNSEL